MPSKTAKQARMMAAVAHDAKFAKKVGIPQSVGRDFNQADKGTNIRKSKRKPKDQHAEGGAVTGMRLDRVPRKARGGQ